MMPKNGRQVVGPSTFPMPVGLPICSKDVLKCSDCGGRHLIEEGQGYSLLYNETPQVAGIVNEPLAPQKETGFQDGN